MKESAVVIPRLNLTSKEHAVDSNNVIARAFYRRKLMTRAIKAILIMKGEIKSQKFF